MTTIKHKFETTLALLEKANACSDGLETLKNSLPSDYPKNKAINLLHILKSNGIIHFFWAFRALKKDSKVTRRLIFHDILKLVQPIYDKQYPNGNVFSTVLKALKTGKGLKEAATAAASYYAAYTAAANAAYNAYNAYNAYSAAADAVDATVTANYTVYAAANTGSSNLYAAADSAANAVANDIVEAVNYVHSATYANVYNRAAANATLDMKVKRRFDDEVVKIIKKYLK